MAEPDRPLAWNQVLAEEFEALRGPISLTPGGDIHHAIHHHPNPTSAVCLSGGGVRSGTFALGVLQGLAHLGVLGKFDYLSTVSGGGYTGGWLTAWLQRVGPEGREQALHALDPAQAAAVTGRIEAAPVDYLRRSCKYLAPSGGATSADFWTLLATLARNLFLNWMVILPLIAAALLIPRMSFAVTESLEIVGTNGLSGMACLTDSPASSVWLGITTVSFLISFGYLALVFGGRGAAWGQGQFLLWCLTPMIVGAVAGANFWAAFPCDLDVRLMMAGGAAIPVAGWLLLTRRGGWRTMVAAAVAGAMVGGTTYAFDTSMAFGGLNSAANSALFALLAVPAALGSILVAIAIFVGLASYDLDDAALEWWSRCGAWIGLTIAAWLVAGTLVFYLSDAFETALHTALSGFGVDHSWSTAIVSGVLPLLGSLAALASRPTNSNGKPSTLSRVVQGLIMPVMIIGLLTSLAWVNLRVLGAIEYHTYQVAGTETPCPTDLATNTGTVTVKDGTKRGCHSPAAGLGETVMLLGGYVLAGLLMSFFVPVNRFSLHGMYRQRIVRTFLGASRPDRTPNAFTGFDGHDDLQVAALRDVRPLHVVCATLNAVSSTRVGQHEKQSQSFTFSPLHAGNREVLYRPAAGYGADAGKPNSGLTLGTALAVSGAAASSAMGMYSSKARAFLLTLANARLGLWFGNPSNPTSWRSSEPPLGVDPIARELLGLTTDGNPFVYLSDGGHYENLGLWEMVARRCRVIVVSDAGADPDYSFDSLSNAVRRIRLDLGIPIEFGALGITKAGELHGNSHGAVGTIHYSVMDGPDAPDGAIVFLRAALSGDEPIDILTYAKSNPEFPNDPTSDQFFDEARFESYRLLGFHTVLSAFRGFEPGGSIANLVGAARRAQPTS